ncbi:MAG: hypothetical protein AAGI50_00210 [Pseudomonadota bacterium]
MYASRGVSTFAVVPSSTIRPLRITQIRSNIAETTLRSWLTQTCVASRSASTVRTDSGTRASTVWSSAVVGSSSTMSSGRAIGAAAITTRWR